jgi:ABC-type lipoprotein export system ATPase subunit
VRGLAVADHVALPLISAGRPRLEAVACANEVLRRVAVDHCAEARLSELSTSELVRVSIAQALVRRPRLLLADEPTDTLNVKERGEILDIVRSVAEDLGTAVLLTTGDASGAMRSTRVASLSEGRLLVPDSDAPGEVVELEGQRRARRDHG